MTNLTDRAREIAGKLTAAQRNWLPTFSSEWRWEPGGLSKKTRIALHRLNLIEDQWPESGGVGLIKYRLTLLGKAVREELKP